MKRAGLLLRQPTSQPYLRHKRTVGVYTRAAIAAAIPSTTLALHTLRTSAGGCWRLPAAAGGCWWLLVAAGGCWRLLALQGGSQGGLPGTGGRRVGAAGGWGSEAHCLGGCYDMLFFVADL